MNKDTKTEINPNRLALIQLSDKAEAFRDRMIADSRNKTEAKFWATRTINYILTHHFYNTKGATEFHTFNKWKELGATIMKGEKAFTIWGQPVQPVVAAEPEQESEATDKEPDRYKFFPLCYLFSNLQVKLPEDVRDVTKEAQDMPEVFETVDLDELL